jgi:hypothetical protein
MGVRVITPGGARPWTAGGSAGPHAAALEARAVALGAAAAEADGEPAALRRFMRRRGFHLAVIQYGDAEAATADRRERIDFLDEGGLERLAFELGDTSDAISEFWLRGGVAIAAAAGDDMAIALVDAVDPADDGTEEWVPPNQ